MSRNTIWFPTLLSLRLKLILVVTSWGARLHWGYFPHPLQIPSHLLSPSLVQSNSLLQSPSHLQSLLQRPILGHWDLGGGEPIINMGITLSGWVPIYLPNFNINSQLTIAAEAPLHLVLKPGTWVRSDT